ncbi:MAG: 6-pyruvoyl-tetrahydropterin synthase-related protein [Nanoarchaeota archaeon]
MKFIKQILFIVIVILVSYFSINNFLTSGFFPIHDNTQVQRVYEMGGSLSEGMFPVRWVADLGFGYGYPIFNFYAPLAYYFGAFFYLLGFNALLATKIMMVVGILISGFFMYLLGKKLFGEVGGITSAMFYVYAPYHAVDIYVRGDIAEFWAYAFIPLVFYSLLKVFKENKWRYIVLGSVSYAAVILSHNLTAFMLTPFLILFTFIFNLLEKKRKYLYGFFLIVIIAIGLSSFYVLPVVLEAKFTNIISQIGGGANFRDHFVCLPQLWDSPWGFGGSTAGCHDGMSFKIGKLHLIVGFFSFLIFTSGFLGKLNLKEKIRKNKNMAGFIIFSIIGFLISIFMLLSISSIIWEKLPFIAFLQYPWRFLIFSSFFTSVLAGALIWFLGQLPGKINKYKFNILSAIALITLLIYGNAKLFKPQRILNVDSNYFTNEKNLKWTTSNTTSEYMPEGFNKPKLEDQLPRTTIAKDDNYQILHEEADVESLHAFIKTDKENANIKINLAYFPAWDAYVDNKRVNLKEENTGMSIKVVRGSHALDLFFIQTPIEKLGNSISLVFLFIIFIGIIYPRKKKQNEETNS